MATQNIQATTTNENEVFDGIAAVSFEPVGLLGPTVESVPDLTPPVVGNQTPAPGSEIEPSTPFSFDVTDNSGEFARIVATVSFADDDGREEVVHNGVSFVGPYAANSARSIIAGGFRYTVLRTGGWPSEPTPGAYAIDAAGNDADAA